MTTHTRAASIESIGSTFRNQAFLFCFLNQDAPRGAHR